MRRRQLAVLGGLMMTTGALAVVAPVSTGVAPATTTRLVPRRRGPVRGTAARRPARLR